ncbi:hypothetical protein F383_37328 [Gossypium arboreum]|uniref:Uncharacterized protein n=1 Tax=Gossypium arboreum TaxID=29729 RepID=A0A0B0MCH9_GOSAR|nr:hypothetical protein F383_37328 [Gossypium arboreum]
MAKYLIKPLIITSQYIWPNS